jgi:hypothetical protein
MKKLLYTAWVCVRHPIISYRIYRVANKVKNKLKSKLETTQKEFELNNISNPYAPGTWDVKYTYDTKGREIKAEFFKLSPKEQARDKEESRKNSKKTLVIPNIHEETVEEARELVELCDKKK